MEFCAFLHLYEIFFDKKLSMALPIMLRYAEVIIVDSDQIVSEKCFDNVRIYELFAKNS